MPINTRPVITVEKPIPPDVLDPIRYRFGGFYIERDDDDNIVIQYPHQAPSFNNYSVGVNYGKLDLRNP